MNFRVITILFSVLMLLIFSSCAGNGSGNNPTAPSDMNEASTVQTPVADLPSEGHNLLGYWNIAIDTENGTVSAIPVRAAEVHLNVLNWLEVSPCGDCLKITGLDIISKYELTVQITLKHPFPAPNLTGFDVRGIAMFKGTLNLEKFNVTASAQSAGDTVLKNADGYTRLYNPSTIGNGAQGYIKGKLSTVVSPDAMINGYKDFYSDENRHYFQAGSSIPADFNIYHSNPSLAFGYAVDASWAKPSQPVNVPGSFPITANCLEAYHIDTTLDHPLAMTVDSKANILIDVYDWQGAATISKVEVEAPYFWYGLKTATEEPGGPATKRFSLELVNSYGFVIPGNWPILIRVTDTSSNPDALIDNVAWKLVDIPVVLNHPPNCAAEVSNTEPEVDEDVTFTDTSTDIEGQTDIVESWWDWENDGTWDEEGFIVHHTFTAPGVEKINHRVIDKAAAYDDLDQPIALDVGLFITLQEDFDSKPIGRVYNYISLNHTYDSGAIINVDDTDGPWDFTTIGLASLSNTVSVLADDDPEVETFAGDFNTNTDRFIRYLDVFDPFFPLLYEAEYHHFGSDTLFIYGFHDPYLLGSAIFGPPGSDADLMIPYPLTIDTDFKFAIAKPTFNLVYEIKAMGEGLVTIPYEGGKSYKCLMLRYKFNVSSTVANGGLLNFAFVNDSGIVVANVIAVNKPPTYNWNTSSNKINYNGMTLFQALNTIE